MSALTGQIKDHGHLIVAIKSSMGMIEGYPVSYDGSSEFADPEIAESVANSDFEKVAKRLGQICTEAASKYREMESGFDATYTRLKDLLYLARDVCREIPPHAVSERAVMLDPSEAARVAGNLKDMINAYRYKLDSTSTIREQALALLSDMIRSGQRIIRYMSSSKNRLPHSILYVGDKQILVAKKGIPRSGAPEELKREADVCDRILDKIADGEIQVLSGLELSTILMREMYPKDLYPKGFDFHLVKMSDLKGSDYVSLSKMQFSGGERAVSAFFLYLLVQNVRSEFYNESMGKGGYIILDNPFANVTRADFIRAITDMATQANYQIIAFTGIKDPSLVPFFKKHIFLTTRKIQSMGREKKVVRRHEFEWKRGYDGAA
jgi:histidinol phosphatase-like PHP family hydrolase